MTFQEKALVAEVRIDICVHKVILCLVLGVVMLLGL